MNGAARKYSVPITELTEALNIPLSGSSEKLGCPESRKHYGIEENEFVLGLPWTSAKLIITTKN